MSRKRGDVKEEKTRMREEVGRKRWRQEERKESRLGKLGEKEEKMGAEGEEDEEE